ncbi:MAG: hypothetical protein QNK23_09200 [Crocinitomicaceae bacterium]|nr:hypothetical protein [Crocinitomicaceae bacterium]
MEFNEIEYKKPFYKIKAPLREHLRHYSRLQELPITYDDLLRYEDLIPIMDEDGKNTLWYSVLYRNDEVSFFQEALVRIYQLLVADGDEMPYLKIASIDFCSFGNSKPFRIKVVNEVNDNHDYYYIKKADASRVYGLELEHIFSPDKVYYLVHKDTLVEDHIVGIPCDDFIRKQKNVNIVNRLRFAKEFVKFNERCFVRLLGDMRAYNFVVEITQDFDNVQYRLRAMDFDQQSFEGGKNIYKPQYFKDNIELVELAQELMSAETAEQYKRQERVSMKKRYLSARQRTKSLLRRMKRDRISTTENVIKLRNELAHYHSDDRFLEHIYMGEILTLHLELNLGIKLF